MPKANTINVRSAARLASSKVGRHSPFTDEQSCAIERHYDDWFDYAFVQNPNSGGRGKSAILTKWKQERAKQIMEGPEFKVFTPNCDYKETMELIVQKFTNWRNFRKKQIEDRAVEIEAIKNAGAVLFDVKTYTKGHDLFKQRKHADIVARKTEVLLSGKVSSSVGAYQSAWKELWDEADQESWEELAKSSGKDIFENQKLFATAFLTGLRGLTQGDALGKMEMLVLYAHREQTGHIMSSLLEVHHDDEVDHFSKQSLGMDIEGFQLNFEAWCDKVLPQAESKGDDNGHITFPRAASGLPLFPEIDFSLESPVSLRKALQMYFESTWEYSRASCFPPWDEITANPSHFYDDNLYAIKPPITNPANLSNMEVYQMISSLSELLQPFEFRRADYITSGDKSGGDSNDDDEEEGDGADKASYAGIEHVNDPLLLSRGQPRSPHPPRTRQPPKLVQPSPSSAEMCHPSHSAAQASSPNVERFPHHPRRPTAPSSVRSLAQILPSAPTAQPRIPAIQPSHPSIRHSSATPSSTPAHAPVQTPPIPPTTLRDPAKKASMATSPPVDESNSEETGMGKEVNGDMLQGDPVENENPNDEVETEKEKEQNLDTLHAVASSPVRAACMPPVARNHSDEVEAGMEKEPASNKVATRVSHLHASSPVQAAHTPPQAVVRNHSNEVEAGMEEEPTQISHPHASSPVRAACMPPVVHNHSDEMEAGMEKEPTGNKVTTWVLHPHASHKRARTAARGKAVAASKPEPKRSSRVRRMPGRHSDDSTILADGSVVVKKLARVRRSYVNIRSVLYSPSMGKEKLRLLPVLGYIVIEEYILI